MCLLKKIVHDITHNLIIENNKTCTNMHLCGMF